MRPTMSYSRPSRSAPSAKRICSMPSAAVISARITTPPGNTGRRSSVTVSRSRSRRLPASASRCSNRSRPCGVMPLARGIELANAVGDRSHGAGAADGPLPAAALEGRLDGLELEARREPGSLDAFFREPAIAEVALAQRYASHLQALEHQRLEALADDDLGAAAADVDHQPAAAIVRQVVRDTRVDQPRLFHAGNDFDGKSEGLACTLQERLLAARDAQRIGADHAHVVGLACRAAAGRSAPGRPMPAPQRSCRGDRPPRPPPPAAPSRAGGR